MSKTITRIAKLRKDNHYHFCVACGRIWQHGDDQGGSDQAHRCPNKKCRRLEFTNWICFWSKKALVKMMRLNGFAVREVAK